MKTHFALTVLMLTSLAAASPPAPRPRATSGDDKVEPQWTEKLTIKAGIREGDIRGDSDRSLQAAVDYVARLGGGTVEILPGTYKLRNSVFLASHVRLTGHGEKTVLVKEPSVTSTLAQDSDWYDQEITLTNPDGFRIGDGICLRAPSARYAIKRTLTARDGSRFKLDRPLRDNVWLAENKATAATLFPILSGENIGDVVIENLTLDGDGAHNASLDGNYAGCIWLQDGRRITVRGVEARSFNGDGISWQVCHDVLVENCHSHSHSGLGLHPGSGSQRSIIRDCRLHGNDIGIFFCWGVKGGLAEENTITGNRVGISIGHRDTDNVVTGNTVASSRETGLLFRTEKDAAAAGHRNVIRDNIFVDNGGPDGAAIRFDAPVSGTVLSGNTITESRGAAQRTGIRIGPGVTALKLEDNVIKGFAQEVSGSAAP